MKGLGMFSSTAKRVCVWDGGLAMQCRLKAGNQTHMQQEDS